MQCYICGTQLDEHEYVCHRCGADILLYKQIIYTSHVFYNQGLEKARIRDISGAIDSLKTSLQYYKYNTKARNLLGLCYYEVGDTVRALNEWIISKNFDPDNPFAERYLAELENDPDLLTKLNSTIKKYNQAIEYCRVGSRDLATILLKKVISTNPHLIPAHQLLGLLYIQEGKYADARKTLIAAAKIDTNNTLTQRYLREVKEQLKAQNTGKRQKKSDIVAFNDGNDTILMPESSFRSMMDNSRNSLANLIVGLVLGLLICFFLIVPSVKEDTAADNSAELLTINSALNSSQSEVKNLKDEVDRLSKQLDNYEGKADITTSYDSLIEVLQLCNAYDYTNAKDKFATINKDVLGESAKLLYDDLYARLAPTILAEYYTVGTAFYTEQNYENALSNFRSIVELDENYENGTALFLYADCLRLTGDNEAAKVNYARVLELFPYRSFATQAQEYLAALGGSAVSESTGTSSSRVTD